MCPKYCTYAQKVASRNSSADSADSLEMVQTGPVWPWVLHVLGGKDDGSLHELLQTIGVSLMMFMPLHGLIIRYRENRFWGNRRLRIELDNNAPQSVLKRPCRDRRKTKYHLLFSFVV